jgi:hypothetical protein
VRARYLEDARDEERELSHSFFLFFCLLFWCKRNVYLYAQKTGRNLLIKVVFWLRKYCSIFNVSYSKQYLKNNELNIDIWYCIRCSLAWKVNWNRKGETNYVLRQRTFKNKPSIWQTQKSVKLHFYHLPGR